MSIARANFDVVLKTLAAKKAVQELSYSKYRLEIAVMDGQIILDNKDIKKMEFCTATCYHRGRKYKLRVYRRIDNVICLFKMGRIQEKFYNQIPLTLTLP